MDHPLLEARDLVAGYGGLPIVRADQIKVSRNGLVLVAGDHGSGKTALCRTMIGLERCVGGSVRLDGRCVTTAPPERRVHAGMGYVPEGRRVFVGLTVRENLLAACRAALSRRTALLARAYDLFPELQEHAAVRAWRLSGGQQQMLAIARALMTDPRLLVLDEPFLGLAPTLVDRLRGALASFAERGLAVLVTDEDDDRLAAVAQSRFRIADGTLVPNEDAPSHR